MNQSKISVRYSKALLLAAGEENQLERVYEDIRLVYQICQEVKEFLDLLHSPVIKPSDKKNVIHSLFGTQLSALTMSLLDLLVHNKRESFIPDISRRFLDDYKQHRGITSVLLSTVSPLDRELKGKVISLIKNTYHTEVELEEKLNKDLIGGFVLIIEDRMMDASVLRGLRRVRQELTRTGLENR
ncbi:MAG: ATP synthase F1 subunit delta [Bacteroidales bacterium]|nr:MAG: ATP synthase F1 subunit delta [Bacteroidales bacterium]